MYPKIGEEFELTLTKDQCDPIAMVKNFGYDSKGWEYNGKIPATLTIKCKLVQIGYCSNLDKARKKLEKLGEIPNGLFLQPFKAKYSETDGNGPIGITDFSWVSPLGRVNFPFVGTFGGLMFDLVVLDLDEDWRWLVLSN